MTTATAPRPLVVPDSVVYRDLDGEVVLLDTDSGTYFGLDEVGSRVWHLLAESGGVERTVEVLLDEYEVAEARLRADVEELTQTLLERGLLRHGP